MTLPTISIDGHPDGVVLSIFVVPGASSSEIVGPHGDRLRVRVSAAAEKGRANREAKKLLEDFFGVPVTLIRGLTARRKRFLLEGATVASVSRRIQEEWH